MAWRLLQGIDQGGVGGELGVFAVDVGQLDVDQVGDEPKN